MKSVAVVALCMFAAAVAEPEASADAGYHYGHYGYGLRPYAYGYYGHPYAYGHHYGKRSADAEPAADADAYYGYPLVAAVPRVSTVHGGPLHGLTAVSHALYGHGLHHPYALAHHGHHGYLGYYGHPYLHHG